MADFHRLTNSDLTVVASDSVGQEMLVLNHRTAPNCPVAWAVRMSMSIPFLWWEVRWASAWGTYRGRDISGHAIVDGGVLSNFPIDLIDGTNPENIALMGNTDPMAAGNLGLLIDETRDVMGAGSRHEADGVDDVEGDLSNHVKNIKTVKRITRLIETMRTAHDNRAILDHEKDICRLPAKGYGTTEFDMSGPRLDALVEAGRTAMARYFG